jgi:hypothetical protein
MIPEGHMVQELDSAPLKLSERDALAPMFRQSMFWKPERDGASAWFEHIPFAFWLIDVLRPGCVVELGTHVGVSYSAMCQAVKTLGLPTRCFAIDTWRGDEHAGLYPEDIYREFSAFHETRYASFSTLIRLTFDQALDRFEKGSIDLLHIDGYHTYEAVRHDFESWRSKLSPNGVIIFHDTNVRENNFGVYRLWEEITPNQPHFEFLHGYGLGVLGLGKDYSGPLRFLFDAMMVADLRNSIREVFASLGQSIFITHQKAASDRWSTEQIHSIQGELQLRSSEVESGRAELQLRTSELESTRAELQLRSSEVESARAELQLRISELESTRAELQHSAWNLEQVRGELAATHQRLQRHLDFPLGGLIEKIVSKRR